MSRRLLALKNLYVHVECQPIHVNSKWYRMRIEDFLLENETILYNSPTKIEYQDNYFEFYLTDQRLIWYKRGGFFSKSDTMIAERIDTILEIKYEEKGFLTKKGAMHLVTSRKTLDFTSSIETIKAIYQQLQTFLIEPSTQGKICHFCSKNMDANARFCSYCGNEFPE